MRKLYRMILLWCLCACVALPLASPSPTQAATPKIHALLIGCQNFPFLRNLAPAMANNVYTLSTILTQMSDSLASLTTFVDEISSAEGLATAIRTAFANAQPGDTCLFYISSHGRFRPEAPEYPAVIFLTDGITEGEITGEQLQAMLDPIPGTKLVLLDACNSGAMIGKGVIPNLNDQPVRPFHTEAYKVLTSAGGNELSWNWSNTADTPLLQGSSYFAKALADGLGLYGQYSADLNRDGAITLDEIYRYLLRNHGSSTVHVYPQRDDTALFHYDPRAAQPADPAKLISSVSFSDDVLTADHPEIEFSFTAHQAVRMRYELVYYRNDTWDWDHVKLTLDTYDSDPESDTSDGTVLPGRKPPRTIVFKDIAPDVSGYILLRIITLDDNGPMVYSSKLLAVMPTTGDPHLRIDAFGEQFDLLPTDEIAIQVVHTFPVQLTVGIYDENNKLVYRLAENQTSRPLHLMPEGSLFYWNGCDESGARVPAGTYTIKAHTDVGPTPYETSAQIELL